MTTFTRVRDGYTYKGDTDLIVMTCPVCGVTYAIPAVLQAKAYERGQGEIRWFCANGHELGYHGKSEAERLREVVQQERDWSARMAAERDQAQASARGHKSAATRVRNRAKAGVCPCCNRTFQQLARHMKTKHPDFDPESGDEVGRAKKQAPKRPGGSGVGEEREAFIHRRWHEGASMSELAAELDTTANSLGVSMVRMRKAGWDLPYRPGYPRPPKKKP